jgi:6-phosphogluconate dehydrogenase
MDLQVPVPNIDISVAMRSISALEEERRAVAPLLASAASDGEAASPAERRLKTENVRAALYAGMVITYAQGFAQLQAASEALGFGLGLEDVASLWRGGCIIRAALLYDIKAAFHRQPGSPNLLLDPQLSQAVISRRKDLVCAIEAGAAAGIAVPGLMTALAYLDAYRAEWLPSNLIQAQRDYFGAHTYRRIDQDGVFHTDWLAGQEGL